MPRAGLDRDYPGIVLGSGGQSSASPAGVRWFAVTSFGAQGDGKTAADGVTTSGSTTFNSASANFQPGDVGKPIGIGQKLPSVSNVTGGSPIVITTSANHGLANGALVMVRGVQGAINANGPWTVAGVTATTFQLSGSLALGGVYTSGGTVYCPQMTTIATRVSATQITLAAAATANGSASTYIYGTDDTVSFQAASAAASLVNGTIYVPAAPLGTRYIVRHPVYSGGNSPACFRISSNCSLLGDGPGSIIQLLPPVSGQVFDIMASTNSFYVGLGGSSGAAPSIIDQNIFVSKVTFDGARDLVNITGAGGGGTEHACYFSRTSNIDFDGCGVQNCGADGIVYEFSQNCTVLNVNTSNCGKTGVYFSGSVNCAATTGTSFANDGGGAVLALCRSCSVSSYNVDSWGSPVGTFGGILMVGDCRDCTITGNTIGNGLGPSLAGIFVTQRTVGTTPSPVFGSTYGAIADPSGAFPYGCSGNTITGNTIRKNAGIGIYVADYCDRNTINDNIIEYNGGVGLQLQACQNNTGRNNKIIGNGVTGIFAVASGASRPCTGNKFNDNDISDYSDFEISPLTGSGNFVTNGTTTVTCATGSFVTELGAVGALAIPRPILIAGETVYHNVVAVNSATSLTLDTTCTSTASGLAASAPPLTKQVIHPNVTQTAAILEQSIVVGPQAGIVNDNDFRGNRYTGTRTIIGSRSKVDPPGIISTSNAQAVATATQTVLPFANAAGYDNDGMHFTSITACTGTVTKGAASPNVVGVGTLFLTELSVGQVIWIPGTANEFRVISAIQDNTHLTVSSNFVNGAAGQTMTRDNTAFVARTPGVYTITAMVSTPVQVAGTRRDIIITLNTQTATVAAGLVTATVGGSTIAQLTRDAVAAGAGIFNDSITRTVRLAQWDMLQFQVFQDSGGPINFTGTMEIVMPNVSPVF
jgi:parallel beta-helix repeat protein